MGGRGGSSGIAATSTLERLKKARQEADEYRRERQTSKKVEEKPTVKTTAKQAQIIDFVSNQTGINLNQWRDSFTERFEQKSGVLVYWKDVPETTKQKILNLSNQYKGGTTLIFEDVGAWGKLIRIKKRN